MERKQQPLFSEPAGEWEDDDKTDRLVATIVFPTGAAGEFDYLVPEELRDQISGICVELNLGGGSFKSQLKRADKSSAMYALILGDEEVAAAKIGLKPLRSTEDQISVAMQDLAATLSKRLDELD